MRHLFKYDSVHGTFPGEVAFTGDALVVAGKPIKVLSPRPSRRGCPGAISASTW